MKCPFLSLFACSAAVALMAVGCSDRSDPIAPQGMSQNGSKLLRANNDRVVPDAYIVAFKEDAQNVAGMVSEKSNRHGFHVDNLYDAATKGFSAHLSPGQ